MAKEAMVCNMMYSLGSCVIYQACDKCTHEEALDTENDFKWFLKSAEMCQANPPFQIDKEFCPNVKGFIIFLAFLPVIVVFVSCALTVFLFLYCDDLKKDDNKTKSGVPAVA